MWMKVGQVVAWSQKSAIMSLRYTHLANKWLTHPWPIFSYLVYFFLGSPMLTMLPVSIVNTGVTHGGSKRTLGAWGVTRYKVQHSWLTQFVHDLLVCHLPLLLLFVHTLGGWVPVCTGDRGGNGVDHGARVHLHNTHAKVRSQQHIHIQAAKVTDDQEWIALERWLQDISLRSLCVLVSVQRWEAVPRRHPHRRCPWCWAMKAQSLFSLA